MSINENEGLAIATLIRWEAQKRLEPGVAREVKSALRKFYRARTANQREKALKKLWSVVGRTPPL